MIAGTRRNGLSRLRLGPVLIGEGVSLFGALPHDLRLRHIGTRQYLSGLVKSEYAVTTDF